MPPFLISIVAINIMCYVDVCDGVVINLVEQTFKKLVMRHYIERC